MRWLGTGQLSDLPRQQLHCGCSCSEAVRQTIDVTPWANARFRLSVRNVLNVLLMVLIMIMRSCATPYRPDLWPLASPSSSFCPQLFDSRVFSHFSSSSTSMFIRDRQSDMMLSLSLPRIVDELRSLPELSTLMSKLGFETVLSALASETSWSFNVRVHSMNDDDLCAQCVLCCIRGKSRSQPPPQNCLLSTLCREAKSSAAPCQLAKPCEVCQFAREQQYFMRWCACRRSECTHTERTTVQLQHLSAQAPAAALQPGRNTSGVITSVLLQPICTCSLLTRQQLRE